MKFSSLSKMIPGNLNPAWSLAAVECLRLGPLGGQHRTNGAEQGPLLTRPCSWALVSIFRTSILVRKAQMEKPQGKSHRGWGRSQKDKGRLQQKDVAISKETELEFFRLKHLTRHTANSTACPSHSCVKVFAADGKEQNDPKMSILFSYNKKKL